MAIYDQVILQPYLPRDRMFKTIIDCGSNIGLTVRYLSAAYPSARIIAIEPDEGNFEILSRNTHGRPGIDCLKAAIWHESGRLSLKREGLNPSGFQVTSSQENADTVAVTIPEIMDRFGIDRLSLLKIDVEGSELEIFSAQDLTWINRVDAISIELHDSWRPGCGDAFFKAISAWKWTFSFHGGAVLCEKR
jgi:FkbM family methyltransferase